MEEQVAQKSTELEQYLQRVRELEDMYGQLEDALEDERRARQDEEAVRRLQARWVNKEWARDKHFEAPCIIKKWFSTKYSGTEEKVKIMLAQVNSGHLKKKKVGRSHATASLTS